MTRLKNFRWYLITRCFLAEEGFFKRFRTPIIFILSGERFKNIVGYTKTIKEFQFDIIGLNGITDENGKELG